MEEEVSRRTVVVDTREALGATTRYGVWGSGLVITSKEIEAGAGGEDWTEGNSIVGSGLDLIHSGTSMVEGVDSVPTVTDKSTADEA